ncbi:hypothetical protein L6452_26293 [Arctium lappa]|uniref:Uncharacterized protein n=1 Tax=Arctium lappa TaxID=4217 RepID=A0ACB9AGV4_ARCLA|nr:hypothetical protein L6452_26293 [Arctium lappa]
MLALNETLDDIGIHHFAFVLTRPELGLVFRKERKEKKIFKVKEIFMYFDETLEWQRNQVERRNGSVKIPTKVDQKNYGGLVRPRRCVLETSYSTYSCAFPRRIYLARINAEDLFEIKLNTIMTIIHCLRSLGVENATHSIDVGLSFLRWELACEPSCLLDDEPRLGQH